MHFSFSEKCSSISCNYFCYLKLNTVPKHTITLSYALDTPNGPFAIVIYINIYIYIYSFSHSYNSTILFILFFFLLLDLHKSIKGYNHFIYLETYNTCYFNLLGSVWYIIFYFKLLWNFEVYLNFCWHKLLQSTDIFLYPQ